MPLPDLNSLNPQVTESYSSEKKFPLKPILVILIVALLLGGGFYLFTQFKSNKTPSSNTQNQANTQPPEPGVIAKVGDELIYQRDLDIELTAYPPIGNLDERKKVLIQKMATDSAILQTAKTNNIIANLGSDIFNSEGKDYLKRLKTIEGIKSKVEGESGKIVGAIVSIWFYNFGVNAPIGYDEGKQLALQKITKLQADVKSDKMTIEQAAEAIRNDGGMSQLDPGSYKQNALQPFDTSVENLITQNPDLDKQLRSLPLGGVSDIFLSTEPFFDKPGFYQFGQITGKVNNSKFGSLDEWIKKGQKNYAITLY